MASKCFDITSLLQFSNCDVLGFNIKMLKPLDDVLRCRICFDYFKDCMITKCSHNYCSLCIRKYMMYRSQCPTCFQDTAEPELKNNRLIDEIVRTYVKIKETLQNVKQIDNKPQMEVPMSVEPLNVKIKIEPGASSDCQKNVTKVTAEDSEVMCDSNEVSCPVCYNTVLKDRINIHLDTCLRLEEKERLNIRKPLPKLVYHLLSEKDIKRKLKEHCLSVAGDKQTLVRRHKNFVVLYNANCDSLNPKSVPELVTEIEIQEIEERANAVPKQIRVHKKSDITEIEKHNATYVKQHQSQFNELIHDVQQRHLDQVIVKQEVKEPESELSGSQHSDTVDDQESLTEESEIHVEKKSTTAKGPSSLAQIESNDREEGEKYKIQRCEEVCPAGNIKEEPFSCELNELCLSKSVENFQDSFTFDSSPSLDDCEKSKMSLNLLRKRKKAKIPLENRNSPKKK